MDYNELFFFAGAPKPGTSASASYGRNIEECTDALFRYLDNGNLSDAEGEVDDSSDSGDDLEAPEPENAESEEESADSDCEASAEKCKKKEIHRARHNL